MMLHALLVAAGCALGGEDALSGLPLSLQEDAPAQNGGSRGFFDGFEIGAWAGVVGSSADFESDPKFGAAVIARLPVELFGLKDLGVFLQGAVTSLDRELDVEPEDPDGDVVAVALGADYDLWRSEDFMLRLLAGVQYVTFSDIFETDDGAGFLVGATGGYALGAGLWFTLNLQAWFGEGGDYLYALGAGLTLRF